MYSDMYMVAHTNKSFRSQLMNKYPYFASEITLLTKNLVSNIEAAGDPASSA